MQIITDFTLDKYRELCNALISSHFKPLKISDYCSSLPSSSNNRVVLIRHDIDRNIKNALRIAELEYKLNIISTFYFRYPYTFNQETIQLIKSFGHEIGYHYEVMAKAKGDVKIAEQIFRKELKMFRNISSVTSVCMHGSPLSSYSNYDFFKIYKLSSYNLICDAYHSINNVPYFSDTGRTWSFEYSMRDHLISSKELPKIRKTDDLIDWISHTRYNICYLTIHPERWNDSTFDYFKSYSFDLISNVGKKVVLMPLRKKE
ncbi:hypothetical protein [Methanospirillum lacunae]|uniref:Polysaccharide deacetylase n=1 Tax=Methanospirillum lacunae TaxID=668570 RepID=A0A2V2N2Q9_9EURY|nr:hypothetical protein [Methanospirillum lacunae]PWR72835.1 hypothetical protein DK846_07765 [Methanospirillum lacunae]